jgi:uncharacterized protein (TIGR03437 family)
VKIGGIAAPLLGVYPGAGQINLQVSSGVNLGTATVEIFTGGSATPVSSGTAKVADAAPGIFTITASGSGQAVVQNYLDYSTNGDFDIRPGARPEASGNIIIIYATGIGNTSPLVPDGQPAPNSPLAVATAPTTVTIGGVSANVLFSGLVPGLVGLWQINAELPASLATNLKTSLLVSLKTGQSKATEVAVANKNEFGTVTGSVVNALTGGSVGGADLSMQPTASGQTRAVKTDANGRYSLYVIAPGGYSLSASAAGFLTTTQGATITGGQSQALAPIALTVPLASSQQYRVVVTWQSGIDLDAHLTGPGAGSSRFHIWWNGENDLLTPPTAQFDRDDTTGAGPETVTFNAQLSGDYSFSVQNYTDRDRDGSTGLAQSGVTVRVYRGNQQVDFFTAPSGGGTLWKVFKVINGTYTRLGQLSDEPDPSHIKVTF